MPDNTCGKIGSSALEMLIGQAVSSVSFVLNYVVLEFDKLTLTCYTLPFVGIGDAEFRHGAPGYIDRLVELIGKTVQSTSEHDRVELSINFKTGEYAKISLRPEDAECVEAAMLHEVGVDIYDVWRYE